MFLEGCYIVIWDKILITVVILKQLKCGKDWKKGDLL